MGSSDLPLNEQERAVLQQRRKKVAIGAGIVLLVLLIGFLSARPVINLVRAWQARRHADKAYAFIEQENWAEARKEAIAAYQLRSNEPEAIRAVARLLSRAGQGDALGFWQQLSEHTSLTRQDLRDKAAIALKMREFDVADATIQKLLEPNAGGPGPADWIDAAELAIQRQKYDEALTHLRRVLADNEATERDQFAATMGLERILAARDATDHSEVYDRLIKMAESKSPVGLDALVALSQRVLASSHPSGAIAGFPVSKLISGLETHPLAKPQHKLLAVDLKIHEAPEDKDKHIQQVVDEMKNGDTPVLVALAAWLNLHTLYQLELDTIPRQRAMQNKDLFFQHVDALGALNRWDEIRRLIESEQFPLDPVIEHMYLARAFAQQGQTAGAENNWGRALQAAAGDLQKLLQLADYAEKNGAFEVAKSAYDAAVSVSPRSRIAQQGRLRVSYALRDTQSINNILQDLVKIWPNDPAVQNDAAYARLLLTPDDPSNREDIGKIVQLAQKLVEQNPTSLPHRTLLAMALLRSNRPAEALAVYKDINIPKSALTTSSVVVHAAVLAANGRAEDAKVEFSHLPEDKLLPEERALIPK